MIGIFSLTHTGPSTRGPQKVFKNLIKGFDLIGVDYRINEICEMNGCLNSYRNFFNVLPLNTLMGPNLIVHPSEDYQLFNKFTYFSTPSSVVTRNYKMFDIPEKTIIFEHATGIDVDFWDINKSIKKDCLIYFKHRPESDLNLVKQILENMNITYDVIRYDGYVCDDLKSKLSEVKFCILLTGTESQGIAYMEILSTNTPCFVFNLLYDDGFIKANSTPYFDGTCGFIHDGSIESSRLNLEFFIDNLRNYTPRQFIINEFTLEKSAKKYIDLLNKCV